MVLKQSTTTAIAVIHCCGAFFIMLKEGKKVGEFHFDVFEYGKGLIVKGGVSGGLIGWINIDYTVRNKEEAIEFIKTQIKKGSVQGLL